MAVYDFGLRLKELREHKRLSQSDVAKRLNVTRSTISGYERNTTTPSLDQIVNLALLYSSTLDYIMGIDNRSFLYLDGFSEGQKRMITDIVERMRQELIK